MQPGSQFYLASYGITGEMLSATMQTISTTAGDAGLQADQAA